MKFKVKILRKLLDKVIQKTGRLLSYTDLKEITDEINKLVSDEKLQGVTFGEKYIYDNIYRKSIKLKEDDKLDLRKTYVDTIARYIGYKDFKDFEGSPVSIIPPEGNREITEELIQRCGGIWWSYVRTNSGLPELLIAPMYIFQENGSVLIQMKGEGDILFQSELTIEGDCVRCLMDTGRKGMTQIYMVMKLGNSFEPTVLLGIFAGMSTGGMPIGGREVWIKESNQGLNFDELRHRTFDMDEDSNKEHKNVLFYFSDKNKNCWQGTLPSSFDMRDLRKG